MTTFFTLQDGRSWLSANGAYDEVLEAIARALSVRHDRDELAVWLLEQRCLAQGPGVGSVDLRALTTENQQRICDAIPKALAAFKERTPRPHWLEELDRLFNMTQDSSLLDKNVRGIMECSGRRSGPGW